MTRTATPTRRVHVEFRHAEALSTAPIPVIPALRRVTVPDLRGLALMLAPLIPFAAGIALLVAYVIAGTP
jgi:hypothetical protein